MMAILCETYPSQTAARQAVGTLRATGVPDRDVQLLTRLLLPRRSIRARRRVRGSGRAEPVGRYAGPPRQRWQAFGGFHGVPDQQRQGSFADTEAINIVTYDHGSARSRLAGDHDAERRPAAAGVTGETARHVIDDLHRGHTLLLGEIASRDTQTGTRRNGARRLIRRWPSRRAATRRSSPGWWQTRPAKLPFAEGPRVRCVGPGPQSSRSDVWSGASRTWSGSLPD